MLVGLFRIILIFLLIYYGVKFVTWLFQMPRRNKNSKFQGTRQKDRFRKEGEVNIDFAPKKNKKVDKENGEYIDYEEVKND
jgi:hypothetical protein